MRNRHRTGDIRREITEAIRNNSQSEQKGGYSRSRYQQVRELELSEVMYLL